MIGLRTLWGISLDYINKNFGKDYKEYFLINSKKFIELGYLKFNKEIITTTVEGKFLSDGIASELFIIDQLDLDLNKSVK